MLDISRLIFSTRVSTSVSRFVSYNSKVKNAFENFMATSSVTLRPTPPFDYVKSYSYFIVLGLKSVISGSPTTFAFGFGATLARPADLIVAVFAGMESYD